LDGDGTFETPGDLTPALAGNASRTVALQVVDTHGCSATSTQSLTVHPKPAAITGPAASLCPGDSVRLGTSPVTGETYAWSPATGLSDPSVSNPLATPSATTDYTLTATNAFGC